MLWTFAFVSHKFHKMEQKDSVDKKLKHYQECEIYFSVTSLDIEPCRAALDHWYHVTVTSCTLFLA